MIFAELNYPGHYSAHHDELAAFITGGFSHVESGHQGDSWIWVFDGENKVAIDTFTAMTHQIKSTAAGSHVRKVIDMLRLKYSVQVYEEPRREGDEND